jgi:hypothetical protein
MSNPFTKITKGLAPYWLRPSDKAETATHLRLIRRLEADTKRSTKPAKPKKRKP